MQLAINPRRAQTGKNPESIANKFTLLSGVLNKSQQADLLSQSQKMIEYSRQLGQTEESQEVFADPISAVYPSG